MKKLSVISNISCKKQSNLLLHLWLGAVIQGQYLLRLRNKDLEKFRELSTVLLDKDKNLPILHAAVFLGTGNCFPKSFKEAFSNNSSLDVRKI